MLGLVINRLRIGMWSNRRWLVACIGVLFMGVCLLLVGLILLLTLWLMLLPFWFRLLSLVFLAGGMRR